MPGIRWAALAESAILLAYLTLWSQLGILTRIYLDGLFHGGCIGAWGVCLTSSGTTYWSLGAYFLDLPSNMLGSFIIGLFAPSAALGASTVQKTVAIVPVQHVWQDNAPLWYGLRTGYCGSLTTFSAWQLQMVQMLIGGAGFQGGQWPDMLWGYVIGLQLPLASYTLGNHAAMYIDRYLVHDEVQRSERELEEDGEQSTRKGRRLARPVEAALLANPLTWARDVPHFKTHAAAVSAVVLTTILFVVLAVIDSGPAHAARRANWLAVLVGPLGCYARFYLAMANGKLPGWWHWLPIGTLAANMLGCAINFSVGVVAHRRGYSSYAQVIWMTVVRVGISGALSTVSTYVMEVASMMRDIPDTGRAYLYGLGSLVAGLALGVVVYGAGVWAP